MRSLLDQIAVRAQTAPVNQRREKTILEPLHEIAADSGRFLHSPLVHSSGQSLERFVFAGERGGGDPINIGIFAGIHGDEPAGSHACVKFAEALHVNPEMAIGYNVFFYPICNPSGFERGTRSSGRGKDLNREFWQGSPEPEVQVLENEIHLQKFKGLISLHSDDTSDGLYGFVRGAVLTKSLLAPALTAAERFLPRNLQNTIDGFAAHNGIISECYDGILTSPPRLENSPFEIILETPQQAPLQRQVDAMIAALKSILSEYQRFLAFAADI
jgi:protein MpaA